MEWASASISRHAGTTDAGRNTAAQNGAMAFKVVDQVKGHHGHSAQFIARDDIQGKIGRNIFFLRRSGCALLCGRGGAVRLALGVCGLGWLLRLLPIGGGGRGGTVRLTLGVRGLGRLLWFLPIRRSGRGVSIRFLLGRATSRRLTSAVWSLCTALWPTARSRISGTRPSTCSSADT